MIPIRDRNPSEITPWVVYVLIAINAAAFLYEISLPEAQLKRLVMTYGFVPRRASAALQGQKSLLGAFLLPLFSCMFLHGGWLHLLGNMWFLYIFGDNVEARLRHLPFLGFYIGCGLLASLAQYALAPETPVPTVGASGAIAGVLGAYIITWPRAKIVTLVPIFYMITFVQLPAVMVLGFWFVIQFFQGIGSLGARYASSGVAYWAHVGGFAAGLVLMKLLPQRKGVARQRRNHDGAKSGRGRSDWWG